MHIVQVLLDGNFVAHAERIKLEWQRLLPKLLHVDAAECHLHITECTLEEMSGLGPEFAAAMAVARSLPLLKCRKNHGHPAGMDAYACCTSLVGAANEGKWILVSQDAELRKSMRGIPGVPLALISNNVLVLEPPSDDSRHAPIAAKASIATLTAEEAKAVRRAAAEMRGIDRAADAAAAPRDIVGLLQPKFKKYAGGPNPLSQRKRKERGEEGGAPVRGGDEAGAEQRTKRKRRRE